MSIGIDFETFYDPKQKYSLSVMDPWEYVHDERFDAYMVSIYGEGIEFVGRPEEFDWSQLEGKTLIAHNMAFDGLVLKRLIDLGIVPDFERQEHCSADLAAYLTVPRNLSGAVKYLYGEDLSKAVRAEMAGMTEDEAKEKGLYEDWLEYALNDAIWSQRIWEDHTEKWPDWEKEASRLNRVACWEGIYVDQEGVVEGLRVLEEAQAEAEAKLPWVADGHKPASLPRLAEFLRTKGIMPPTTFKKDSEEMTDLLERTKDNPEVSEVLQARLDVASLNPHIARLRIMRDKADENNILRFSLRYFGAHTGRNASGSGGMREGSSKFNPLNLPKEPVHGVDLRGLLMARPGHKLVVFDYGQIEARIILWLAGHKAMLDLVKTAGSNLYIAYGRLINRIKPEDIDTPEKIEEFRGSRTYEVLKACVLSMGFGQGAVKFRDNTEERSRGMLVFTLEEAEELVREWRSNNEPVVQLWRTLDHALTMSADRQDPRFSVTLPSGRIKNYYRPKKTIVPRKFTDRATGEEVMRMTAQLTASVIQGQLPMNLWGGIIAQNITQATARDVMTQGSVEVVRQNPLWRVLWTIYDEIVFEVPEDQAQEAFDTIPEILCNGEVSKTWGRGIPLNVSGYISDRYKKD